MKKRYSLLLLLAGFLVFQSCQEKTAYKALIVTGQSNHNWAASAPILKTILDQTELFTTDIAQTPPETGDMKNFRPNFKKYNVVVIDYNGVDWSEETKAAFLEYVNGGGGVVIYHEADNSFPDWKEYNEIIGLGGWNKRAQKDGPYVYYKKNELVIDTTAGSAGSHGPQHEYLVRARKADHPILKGLPVTWMHGKDELYSTLRGPAKNMEILATAYADTAKKGTGRDEPMLMTISYGQGRIFHTAMGHVGKDETHPATECVGFIVTFQRGAEWAACGKVTQPIPLDFPNVAGSVSRPDYKIVTLEEDLEKISKYTIDKSTRYLTDLQGRIRKVSGNPADLLELEKKMVDILRNPSATPEGKTLILKELAWMGSDYCVPTVQQLLTDMNLQDAAAFTLERMKGPRKL
ncbi:MAG TPA: ThuA domain-containing protein [Prolixibacteraceae bacterium]|nr:ThuA domain-containing protein [Prolixibacteraceae bacterium]